MNQDVKKGEWITIKADENSLGINGYIFDIFEDGTLSVGYYQNDYKAIKEDVIWTGSFWKFKYDGPNGSYLKGHDEFIVKQGPYQNLNPKITNFSS